MIRLEFFENPRFSAASGAITLVFFALFGSVFLLTQYLQFVRGYTPLQAGIRLMPVGVLIVAAPLAARAAERFGTKVVVAAGLVTVAVSLALLSGLDTTTDYGRIALALAILGGGMGTTMAPATESIMGSLPLGKAGVGSAMNDTTRQVGGALGVAVLGSVLSSAYASSIAPAVGGLPASAAAAASDSIGAATAVAAQIGGAAGQALLAAADRAFVDGLGIAVLIASVVAGAGALLVILFLPSRAREDVTSASAQDRVVRASADREERVS